MSCLSISEFSFKLKCCLIISIAGIMLLVQEEFLSNHKMFAGVESSLKMSCKNHEYSVLDPSGSYGYYLGWVTDLVCLAQYFPSPFLHGVSICHLQAYRSSPYHLSWSLSSMTLIPSFCFKATTHQPFLPRTVLIKSN